MGIKEELIEKLDELILEVQAVQSQTQKLEQTHFTQKASELLGLANNALDEARTYLDD